MLSLCKIRMQSVSRFGTQILAFSFGNDCQLLPYVQSNGEVFVDLEQECSLISWHFEQTNLICHRVWEVTPTEKNNVDLGTNSLRQIRETL